MCTALSFIISSFHLMTMSAWSLKTVWELFLVVRASSTQRPRVAHLYFYPWVQIKEQVPWSDMAEVQNIDGLHAKAGSSNVVELHGSMWRTRCCHCNNIQVNLDMPICPALESQVLLLIPFFSFMRSEVSTNSIKVQMSLILRARASCIFLDF